MAKLNGFKWLCALAFIVSTANADIIIDNQSIPSADVNTISISPASGHMFITTIPGYTVTPNVAGDTVAITNFTVSPATVIAGQSATVSWNTANAVSCVASNGVGGWAGSTIALPSGSKSITTSTTGSPTFTLTCNGSAANDTVSKNVVLNVTSANTVSITNFTASPATIIEGESTTLSWTTQNASSCTPTGGTAGWSAFGINLPNGSASLTLPTAGTYSFTLTCQDVSAGTAVKSTVVIVSPAAGECPASPLSGTTTLWKSFWLVDFPKPGYDNRFATIPRYGYLALEFNTGNIISNGSIVSIETTVTDGVRLGALSKCPGDFDVTPECEYVWGIGGGLGWATNGTRGCQLEPNTTYYFNVTFTDGFDGTSSSCRSSPCITTIQHINR